MARFISEAANPAHRTHQAVASCAGSLSTQRPCYLHLGLTVRCRGRLHQCTLRPRQARAPELGVRRMLNSPLATAKRAACSAAIKHPAFASWLAQGVMACLHSSWPSTKQSTNRALMHTLPSAYPPAPNWALQGTPIRTIASAMPSARP